MFRGERGVNMKSRRGVSAVVTTVLILLVALAAIVLVWNFIKPTIEQTGESLESKTACLSVSVEPTACDADTGTVTVRLVTDPDGVVTKVRGVLVEGSNSASETEDAPDVLATTVVDVGRTGLTQTTGIEITYTASAVAIIGSTECDASAVTVECIVS